MEARDSQSGSQSVSEIHGYPLRPPGFTEPLFATSGSRREVAEHLLGAPWLRRASELPREGWLRPSEGAAVHRPEERVVLERENGRVYLVRRRGTSLGANAGLHRRGCGGQVERVLERWREVGGWWSKGGGRDRLVFRVRLTGGAVVDLALERRSREWFLAGIVD